MLLGSTSIKQQHQSEDILIARLIGQGLYAEAYSMLKSEAPDEPVTLFNTALCYYYIENYQEALIFLEKSESLLPPGSNNASLHADSFYKAIRDKQNQTADYKQGITKKYLSLFNEQVRDAITRLKTDCWLQLEQWAKVVETGTPVNQKNYRNVIDALQGAKNKLSQL